MVEEGVVVEVPQEVNPGRDPGQGQDQYLQLPDEDGTPLRYHGHGHALVRLLYEDDHHHHVQGVHRQGQMGDEENAQEVLQEVCLRLNRDLDLLQFGDAGHHRNQEVHLGDDRGGIHLHQGLHRDKLGTLRSMRSLSRWLGAVE